MTSKRLLTRPRGGTRTCDLEDGTDLDLLIDSDRPSYKAAGAKLAVVSELLGPRLMWRGLKRARAGRGLAGQDDRTPGAGRRRARRRLRRLDPVGAHEPVAAMKPEIAMCRWLM